jgi:hypothetical protein
MSADCGCGCGGSCATTMTELAGTGFVRPKFFGGMLLTEDDLQAAIDYMVAKRKLTNREVFGAGVVCGLTVKPDPCDTRSVIVSPGYAIECCGNDILVSCAETVDIIDLVRDLRQRTGVDCGEPCDEQPNKDYHLVVCYAETPTAPVAPYAPDDCATGDCEFSRISEGYRFELSCEPPDHPRDTMAEAIAKCRQSDKLKRSADDMMAVVKLVDHHDAIAQSLRSHEQPLAAPPPAAEFRKIQVDPGDPDKGVRFDQGVKLVNRVLSAQALEASGSEPGAKPVSDALIARTKKLAEELRRSDDLEAKPADEQERIKRLLTTAVEQPDLSDMSAVDRGWLREGMMPIDAERTFVAKAESARATVLRQLEDQGQTGSEEYRAVTSMQFKALNDRSARDAMQVAYAWLKAADACECAAYHPPCATCTDGCVELAKVRVEGCDVVDVCELHRHWVLSPRAVNYWYPIVDSRMELLERRCCGYARKPFPAEGADRQEFTPMAVVRQASMRVEEDLQAAGGDAQTLRAMDRLQRQLDTVTRRLDKLAEEKEVPA